MSRLTFLPCIIAAALFAFQLFVGPANAQTPTRQLTLTGDVLEFVWSSQGDHLYVTREGEVIALTPTQLQTSGDLYRVDARNGAAEPLARNANMTRAPREGTEIAFVRLALDGSAEAIGFSPDTKQERRMGEIAWGALPQWNLEGEELFYIAGGQVRRASKTGVQTVPGAQSVPGNARVSPLGDRAAFLDAMGLWVVQSDSAQNLVHTENDTAILAQFVWANGGDQLAFIVTHSGFDPEVWIADTTSGTTQRVAKGQGLEHFANLAWSPDDTFVIFTRTPTGSSSAGSSEVWRARRDGSSMQALTDNNLEETLPQYAPGGDSIAFLANGDVWVMELDGNGLPFADATPPQRIGADFKTQHRLGTQRTPPALIRVRHDAANSCRSVPVGQIDTIDFETYVKRVVPSEVFASWDDDALKTQVVAARTYAWFWILQHTTWQYDVTDSTAYQYMCEVQYASTDDATEATRGEYLDYQGFMVFAAYGAENGDPTLTNSFGNPYLLGVDDPVGFMRTRAGNGIGMSQWGAQRWALQYDWNYQQVLRHYYSNITLEAPADDAIDTGSPIGALVSPRNHWGVTSNRVHIVANASDGGVGIDHIDLYAQYVAGDGVHDQVIATMVGAEREFTWDVTLLPNQTNIQLTPLMYDGQGNSTMGAGLEFDLDRRIPRGRMHGPATTTTPEITLNVNASDKGGSTLVGMMFSNDWEWQGENQYKEPDSGTAVADPGALNGFAMRGLAGANSPGAWYGPYTDAIPTNAAYRAYFRIKTDDANTPDEIALLDVVVDGGASILGLKRVRGVDMQVPNEYQEFYVDFYYSGYSTHALEFRVAFRSTASLWLDRILIVRYPIPYASSTLWTLANGEGTKRVTGKFLDGAGNVSQDASAIVFFGQNPPPVLTPRNWLPLLRKEH